MDLGAGEGNTVQPSIRINIKCKKQTTQKIALMYFFLKMQAVLPAARNHRRMFYTFESKNLKFLLVKNMNEIENPTIIWEKTHQI